MPMLFPHVVILGEQARAFCKTGREPSSLRRVVQSRSVVASSRGRSTARGRYHGPCEIRAAVQCTVEKLEHRALLSSYTWNSAGGTLLIDLTTNDQMTIAE